MQKRALAIHDISCFGRCSLTVALPILSAAGIETTILPTAVLSTHTGGFSGYTVRDLTDDLRPIKEHWFTEKGITFHAIYSGYLASFEQLDIVKEYCDAFHKEDCLFFCDPVMGDNGVLYNGFTADFPKGMASLCAKADLIIPNLTEATLMLGEEYPGDNYDRSYIESLLHRLAALGPKMVVLTGVIFDEDKLGSACLDAASGTIGYAFTPRIHGHFHGTGDVYGSVLIAAMMKGVPLARAIEIAGQFTYNSILRTLRDGTDVRFGVNFEEGLIDLAKIVE